MRGCANSLREMSNTRTASARTIALPSDGNRVHRVLSGERRCGIPDVEKPDGRRRRRSHREQRHGECAAKPARRDLEPHQHDDPDEQQMLRKHRDEDRFGIHREALGQRWRLRGGLGLERSGRDGARARCELAAAMLGAHELLVLPRRKLGLAHRLIGEQAEREHCDDDRGEYGLLAPD